MADEVMELANTDAVGDGVPAGTATPTGAPDGTRQPEPIDLSKIDLKELEKVLDLDKLEKFQSYKSSSDRRISAAERQAQEAARRAQEIEAAYHQQYMATLDDAGKIAYENKLLKQRMAEIERQRELELYAYRKDQDIREVARRKGLSYDTLVKALPENADAFVLWETAENLAATSPKAAPASPASQTNNHVDMGQGKPAGSATRYDQMKQDAYRNKSVSDLLDAWAAAGRDGINLD